MTWKELSSIFMIVALFLISIVIISRTFGKHFITVLREGSKLEFKTMMGLFCFLGFAITVYLGLHSEVLAYILLFVAPENMQSSIIENLHSSKTLFLRASTLILLSNFVLMGIIHKNKI